MILEKQLKEYLSSEYFKDAFGILKSEDIEYKKLAQGEYNINYIIFHPRTKEKMILRINTGSQMNLDNQIEYEYNALKILENSKRTPKPLFVDGSKKHLEYGLMVMEFLEGKSLDYKKDLSLAADCLADIHKVVVDKNNHLISPENPLQAILDECNEMFKTYFNSSLGDAKIKYDISRLLYLGEKKLLNENEYDGYICCVNTELNSGNFLINGKGKNNYLIDWEKPIYGNPVQDLGHFLAPTTTFWKTDVVLTKEENDEFVKAYFKKVNNEFKINNLQEQLDLYISINCLRGITWCSMAWVEYQESTKIIKNEDTFKKMEAYLEKSFLEYIENIYF